MLNYIVLFQIYKDYIIFVNGIHFLINLHEKNNVVFVGCYHLSYVKRIA
jgi:hypothetical protein